MKRIAFILVAVGIGCGQPAQPPTTEPAPVATTPVVTGNATITGKVLYRGEPPAGNPIKMAADPFCESAHGGKVAAEELLVNADGSLRNVFVYVKEGLTDVYPPPATPVVLDQVGCMYRPRVQGLQVGQVLVIRNSDDTLHNVHALADQNKAFNIGQPVRGMEAKKVFPKAEVMLRFKCDVHPWMSAYLGIVPHPFHATTQDTGNFQFEKLPPGRYVLEAWHEKLGTKTATVEVADTGSATVEFVFP